MNYLPPLLRVARRLGYQIASADRDYCVELVAVRNQVNHRKPDVYCDDFHVFWRQPGGWRCFTAGCNTSPGKYFQSHPHRPSGGCAIMLPGQYRGAFYRGPYKGQAALLHRGARINYFRDSNPLDIRELDPVNSRGAGFHIHRGSTADRVGKFTTGAQTLSPADMDTVLELCDKQIAKHGIGFEAFTYTLIGADQIWQD